MRQFSDVYAKQKNNFLNNKTINFLGALSMCDHAFCARKIITPPDGPGSKKAPPIKKIDNDNSYVGAIEYGLYGISKGLKICLVVVELLQFKVGVYGWCTSKV